jgi:hypothetical protein
VKPQARQTDAPSQTPFRFAIPDSLRPNLAELRRAQTACGDIFAGAVVLSLGMLSGFLAPDGRVIACDAFGGGPLYEVSDEREAYFLVACGAEDRSAPELLGLLPPRPFEATECRWCVGRGWEPKTGWPCFECGSLGWVRTTEKDRE